MGVWEDMEFIHKERERDSDAKESLQDRARSPEFRSQGQRAAI
jgi:hypothetical protein